ncbi:histone family protein [Candidatus Woesearchaeota archaeon]|nr:histone family protein [Candidatus Woesearchaeota archaeon]
MGRKYSTILPQAPVARLIQKAGATRVSDDAAMELVDILSEYGTEISKYAVKIAEHSGRKTVRAGDVKLAAEKMK